MSLASGTELRNCLKVLVSRTSTDARGRRRFFSYSLHLAPNLGEVRREVVLDGAKVATIELSGYALKSDRLGN